MDTTSFPGSLILPPGGKMRDPGNEVGMDTVEIRLIFFSCEVLE